MKYIKFLLVALLTFGLIHKLSNITTAKDKILPAMGSFFNPFSGFWQNAEPVADATMFSAAELPGLKAPVKVVFDDRKIPHIFAENTEDAVMVQGYLTAKDRLWQLDITTRSAAGRLSEVVGERALAKDQETRRMGMVFGAENSLKSWEKDPKMMAILDAYSAGINAYTNALQPKDYPIEFKFLKYAPEPWSRLRSALFLKAMSRTLALQDKDVATTQSLKRFGQSEFNDLFPEFFEGQDPIIPEGTKYNFKAPASKADPMPPNWSSLDGLTNKHLSEEGVGSNNWVVAGSKTLSGKPILCGDPHLNLTVPSIWYEIQLHTPEMNVYGASLPGIPFVVIGFNENIAWTNTNVGQDVADYYAIKWLDKDHKTYEVDGATQQSTMKIEEYKVVGREDVVKDTVLYTSWGPVVSNDKNNSKYGMAFHWLAHEGSEQNEIQTYYLLNKAKNYDEFTTALKNFSCPAQNFAYADRSGDIAMYVEGNLPIKVKEQGRFVQDGSKSSNKWGGFIPNEQLPHQKNPARGYVSSANQISTGKDYPYYYNSEGFEKYRGRIINKFLSKMDSITVDDMKSLQNNNYSLLAEESLPLLMKAVDTTQLSAIEKAYYDELKTWNLYFDKDKTAPIYFAEWSNQFYNMTWADDFMLNKPDSVLYPTEIRTINLLKKEPNSKYFDNTKTPDLKENAGHIATAAFHKMADIVAEKRITNPTLTWSSYKDTYVEHLGRFPGFSRTHINNGGHGRSINSMKEHHGPSWRMIVDMAGERPKGYVVYPGGESGNPGSKHYDDFLAKWTTGEYYEAFFMKTPEDKAENIILTSQDFNPKK
jgi:penicillin G amidase